MVVDTSPLSVTAKHQLTGNEGQESSESPGKKQNGPPEMPVPELPTVSEITAYVRSSAGEFVLFLDSGFHVADFHPEYEYFDDQLISQPPLMSLEHSSTANTKPARQPMLLPAG